ncbi:aminodeoxychorismate/anthranilate synthase component II [Pontibacillus yanchengensis]|uniref:Aminodeoxychorismate/anthranilate synthase component II n=3 Tax=Pontibacillus yanchengensis TaxID=462910 RepID=A0ACC7VHT1_9BACI|nr:aminodeoxychorismate/anthranilate synthase component II [Pontibacillus yanchengensis]MYL35620.1 aminodeoxychorismate/anthranilate synthase component II [Pontibacillus yanchengensis]MYL53680.1 aminodeoxychorismate/anthranilate synthase component II [Pontibacillus yanchengensis]
MIVIIDNYDSFTYNLAQYIEDMVGQVAVYRNDAVTLSELKQLEPNGIILSPGPGTPDQTGISRSVLETFYREIPILGVCLGHQLIVEAFGGSIQKGASPMHGKVTTIHHDEKIVYQGVPTPTNVTRYHSLIAQEGDLPKCLQITAKTYDGVIMGVRHKHYPVEGLQFHPESILSTYGYKMLQNFIELTSKYKGRMVGI